MSVRQLYAGPDWRQGYRSFNVERCEKCEHTRIVILDDGTDTLACKHPACVLPFLDPEWDSVLIMEVYGNASAPEPHTPLPQFALDWLAADERREIVFTSGCNVMNRDLPLRARTFDGRPPVHVQLDALLERVEIIAPDGDVTIHEVRGPQTVD